METIYLDNAATTPLDPRVLDAMLPWLAEHFGNPSSRHAMGVRAAEAMDASRQRIARAVGARVEGVVFTSGGTEANNLAVLGSARRRGAAVSRTTGSARVPGVVIGPTEHDSVRAAAFSLRDDGFRVAVARLSSDGSLDLEHFLSLLDEDTVCVAQMLVQNEIGTIYPVRRLAAVVRARAPRAHFHVDAVQALGKLDLSLGALGADSISLSAHKVHGPKGSGALVLAEGVPAPRPLILGGGQERDLRSGTENVAGAVGFGLACELAADDIDAARRSAIAAREELIRGLRRLRGARCLEPRSGGHGSASAAVSGSAAAAVSGTVPAIAALYLPGAPAEVRLHHLERRGVYVGAGAACQSRKRAVSPALLALGLSVDEAREVLRVSFSRTTTVSEVSSAVQALMEVEAELEVVQR